MYECDVWAAANSESGTASKTNSALARPENKLVYYCHHNFYTVYPRTSALGIFVFGGVFQVFTISSAGADCETDPVLRGSVFYTVARSNGKHMGDNCSRKRQWYTLVSHFYLVWQEQCHGSGTSTYCLQSCTHTVVGYLFHDNNFRSAARMYMACFVR